MKIVVLYGEVGEEAPADEQDALVQVEVISAALSRFGHTPIPVSFSLDVRGAIDTLHNLAPDIAFNIVESVEGQGRLIHLAPAILDFLKIPYTGARTEAMFLTSNKLLGKTMFRGSGILTPDWFTVQNLNNGVPIHEDRYIVKSVWEHASVGLSEDSIIEATCSSDLRTALEQRQQNIGGEGFVEAYIEGREFNLSLLAGGDGPEVLPPAEIRFDDYPQEKLRIVDYRTKWDDKSFEYHHTPRCFDFPPEDESLLQRLKTTANQCWKLFGLRGYARVDFRVDHAGSPWVLEVNANPCLSPDAGFIAAANEAGLSFDQVIERILQDAYFSSGSEVSQENPTL
jgi:D-alanine-D-alanine ligase